jgi:hypothetical protein
MDLALPAEMVEGVEAFKEFYEGETKHRKLQWVYTQARGGRGRPRACRALRGLPRGAGLSRLGFGKGWAAH